MLSRASEIAISAMGYLAEVYDQPDVRLSTADIAQSRRLKKPFVAKVLTTLSHAGLILGSPGPGGGYRLAQRPDLITLKSIVELFENENKGLVCPYGPDYCGRGNTCPLHDSILGLQAARDAFLERTTLAGFQQRRPTVFDMPELPREGAPGKM